MSYFDCIMGQRGQGLITDKQARELTQEYEKLFNRYRESLGDEAGAYAAADHYTRIKEQQIIKKNQNAVRDVLAFKRINKKVDDVAKAYSTDKEAAGKMGLLWSKSPIAASVRAVLEKTYTRAAALERRATLSISEVIEKYRSKNFGFTQDAGGFKNVVREMLGEGTGDAFAKTVAAQVRKTFDELHRLYDASGGMIGKIENYFPQIHNANLVAKLTDAQWIEKILPRLDRERMIDPETALPYSDADLIPMLKKAYKGIITGGLDEVAERAAAGKTRMGAGGGIAMRNASSRFLHFKSAEDYLAYNAELGFGDEGLFDAMLHHIHTMTRDIALMQELGPKPDTMIERLKLKAQAEVGSVNRVKEIQGMYDILAGRNGFGGQVGVFTRIVKDTQNILRSVLLGGTPISALGDSVNLAFTAKMNGMQTTKVMGQYFSLLNPADAGDREIAKRISFVVSAVGGRSIANSRFLEDSGSSGLASFLASLTNRASGLSVMTDAVKNALPTETMGFMAASREAKVSWSDLDPNMRKAFERWDMDETDYNNIINSDPHLTTEEGASVIRPEDVAVSGKLDTAQKYEMWLTDMMQTASNEPRLLTRAITSGAAFGDAKTGSVLNNSVSTLMMLKSYAVSNILNHFIPYMRDAALSGRYGTVGAYLLFTTLAGASAIQARQVIYGKEPISPDKPRFWMAAIAQGGGLGIFGDFFFSDQSRFGADFLTTLAGPGVGFINDTVRLTKGNIDRYANGEDPANLGKDFFLYAKRYAPVPGLRLWYTKLLFERMMLDQIEAAIDPRYDSRIRRIENKMQKDYDQKFWWRPGQALPETAR